MNSKRRNFILIRITDHPHSRVSMNKSMAETCKEESIYL